MARFTAEQAHEAHEEGEPIIIALQAARRIVGAHETGEDFDDFLASQGAAIGNTPGQYDAWTVLEWLGY